MPRRLILLVLVALLIATGVTSAFAGRVNRYPVDRVTIAADRQAHEISGRIIASSTTEHFCTLGTWPLNIFKARAGKDKKVAHLNRGDRWSFDVPRSLRGSRLYAEVPSYPVHEHGYCVGARSRAVRAG